MPTADQRALVENASAIGITQAEIANHLNSIASDRVTGLRFAEIAEREAQSERHIRLLVPLAFLSPRIVVAIVNGTAPADLTVTGLAKDRELQPVDFP